MNDKAFLKWLHERLEYIHDENPSYDYMLKLQSIIDATPDDKHTPNVSFAGVSHLKSTNG